MSGAEHQAACLLLVMVERRRQQLRRKARRRAILFARMVAPHCLSRLGLEWGTAPREVEEAWRGLDRLARENPADRLIRELCMAPWMVLAAHWACPSWLG